MATIEDVYSLLAENGAIVKFTNDSQLAPLRSMLSEILGKANTSLVEGNKKSNKLLSDTGKSRDKLLKSMNKGLDNVEKAVKEQKGGMLGFLKSGNLWMNAGKMLLGAASMLIDYGKQYYGNLKKLSDAGVRISEGFDRAFGAYAAVANMSHENFAKLLIQNKRFVTRMNSVAQSANSGAKLISEMAAKLNGRFALDEEQTGTILEFFTEITNSMSRRKLTDNYLTTQAELLGKTMKGLSHAVGMSIEQFKEKVKMDEQDLAERRIMRDPRTRGRYMLNKAAMGKDAALYLETGIPNEKVLNMMANPAQQAFFQNMMQANQKTNSTNIEELKKYAEFYKTSMIKFIDPIRENFDKQSAAFLGLSGEWGQGQFGSMNFLDISPEMFAKAIDGSDIENQTVDGINMLNRSVDVIKDLLVYQFFKKSKIPVADALKAVNKGGTAVKKLILGDAFDEFQGEMLDANLIKMKKRTSSIPEYEEKIKNNEKIINNPYYNDMIKQSASKDLVRYREKVAAKKALNEVESLKVLNNMIKRGETFENYEEFRKNNPEYGLAEFVKFGDKYYSKNQIETFKKYNSIGGINEMTKKVYSGGYDIQGHLNKSIFPKNIKPEDYFTDMQLVRELKENNVPMVVELSAEDRAKLDNIAANTKNQAEGINEANSIQKSNAADSSYNNMVTPGPFAVPAY